MDTNPHRLRRLRGRVILFILLVTLVLMQVIQSLRDWVAGDIQSRLIPGAGVIVLPFVIVLLVYTFREGNKPR